MRVRGPLFILGKAKLPLLDPLQVSKHRARVIISRRGGIFRVRVLD
jgi:hypothetical protein